MFYVPPDSPYVDFQMEPIVQLGDSIRANTLYITYTCIIGAFTSAHLANGEFRFNPPDGDEPYQ